MGELHELIMAKGKRAVLDLGIERRLVEAAASYLSDDDTETSMGFAFSGWAQVALPHRKLANDAPWMLETDRAVLMIQPGIRRGANGKPEAVGVPFGSRARMIMLYLQTQAIRTNSREVELGRSLREWLSKMGISIGGNSVREVKDQAERISRCRLSLEVRHEGRVRLENQLIVDRSMFLDMDDDGGQTRLSLEAACLSQAFFDQLRRHPVPIEENAIKLISNHSMALDIYLWLAFRLHALSAPRSITWAALKVQFGGGINLAKHFKPRFSENLALAMAVYPEAKVEVSDAGLTLYPSRPPIAKRVHSAALPSGVAALANHRKPA